MALNSKPNSKSYPLELSRSALWVRGEIVLIRNSLLVHVSCYQIVVGYSEGSVVGSLLIGTNFFYSKLQMYIHFRFKDMACFFFLSGEINCTSGKYF